MRSLPQEGQGLHSLWPGQVTAPSGSLTPNLPGRGCKDNEGYPKGSLGWDAHGAVKTPPPPATPIPPLLPTLEQQEGQGPWENTICKASGHSTRLGL